MSISNPRSCVLVLGCGITGLQTAFSLLKAGYFVTIVAEHFPGDTSIEYTSPWAGGVWRAHSTLAPEDKEVAAWDQATLDEWTRLLREGDGAADIEEKCGLGIRECVNYWSIENAETVKDGSGLWWKSAVEDFRLVSEEELAHVSASSGEKIGFGVRYKTVFINIPKYLQWLFSQVQDLGANFLKSPIKTDNGADGVISGMLQLVAETDKSMGRPKTVVEAVVLAAGLSSRHFLPTNEGGKLYPVRGQTVLVKGEAKIGVTHLFPSENGELLYVIPRPSSGTTILGGCKQVGNWDAGEDKELTQRILERVKRLKESKEIVGENGEFEVVSVQVGRRPGRIGGPRVDIEKEKVHGVKVIYSYGHSGAGYQNSVGSAAKVVRLLIGK